MKNYELVCILDPQVGEGQYEQVVEKYEGHIKENGGEIVQVDAWGLRRLAYTSPSLKNRRQGYYVIYQFTAETEAIDALEQTLKLDDGVLRYLLTVVDGEFIHVAQLAADNFLQEAFARPPRGPRDRDSRGSRDRDSRGPRDREDSRPPRDAEPSEAAAEAPKEAVAQESDDA